MKTFWTTTLCTAFAGLLAACGALAPAPSAAAEGDPAIVVSVAGIEDIIGDISYLGEAAGVPELADVVKTAGLIYTTGLDKTRPSGAWVVFEDLEPVAVAFVPVTDLKSFLKIHERQIDKPVDVGDGVLRVGKGQSYFIKEQNGWAFLAQDKAHLATVPMDPSKMTGELNKDYTVAVQVKVQSIPETYREMFVSEMKAQSQRNIERLDREQRDLLESVMKMSLNNTVQMVEETDTVTIGWAVDSMAKETHLDITMTAIPGTKLARRMETLKETKTDFAGFLDPGAALTTNYANELTDDDSEQIATLVAAIKTRALEAIEKDEKIDDEALRAGAKDVMGKLLDVVQATVKAGKLDGGAVVLLGDEKFTFAAGMKVADGMELDAAIKKAVKLLEREPQFPGAKLDAEKHAGITFHTMNIEIPEREKEARRLFGETLDVAVGIGPESAYVAFGNEPVATLKGIIDRSASSQQSVPAGQLTISLAPILKFAASVDENPILDALNEKLAEAEGKDQIRLTSTAIENGAQSRISVDEGALKVLGEAVKQAIGAFGGGGGFEDL